MSACCRRCYGLYSMLKMFCFSMLFAFTLCAHRRPSSLANSHPPQPPLKPSLHPSRPRVFHRSLPTTYLERVMPPKTLHNLSHSPRSRILNIILPRVTFATPFYITASDGKPACNTVPLNVLLVSHLPATNRELLTPRHWYLLVHCGNCVPSFPHQLPTSMVVQL